jgi:hypothetical protein
MVRLMLVAITCACAASGAGSGDPAFRVFYPDAPASGFHAKVGKRFSIKPVAHCVYDNGHDARWSITGARVASGALPPGLVLEEGSIGGIPTEAGSWTLTVKFTGPICAGKPHDILTVDVTITVAARR